MRWGASLSDKRHSSLSNSSIHPATTLGYVHLTVSDLSRSLTFYQQVIGLQVHEHKGDTARLGAGVHDLVWLTENPSAKKVNGTTGLYHFAILVPSRIELARSLRHLLQTQWPLQGFADHLVSEAIYLPDPDGNGIEIYRDRPRSEWSYDDNQIVMGTDPLDVEAILKELGDDKSAGAIRLHPDTILGHVHLHVADLARAEAFYTSVLGFDLVLRFGPAAGFVSAGGYHHHIGFNTWAGQGASPPPPDAVGLRYFVVQVPNQAELGHLADRAKAAGLATEDTEQGLRVLDPSQNGVMVTISDLDE